MKMFILQTHKDWRWAAIYTKSTITYLTNSFFPATFYCKNDAMEKIALQFPFVILLILFVAAFETNMIN